MRILGERTKPKCPLKKKTENLQTQPTSGVEPGIERIKLCWNASALSTG